ncbi:hypothetical protein TNCV_802861 [Trichonephila clavipes]|nr:hypothetical protein TNCV_802861 [Trichonephila clavipes]
MLNDDEIATFMQTESNPVDDETDENEDNNQSSKDPSNAGAFSALETAMECNQRAFGNGPHSLNLGQVTKMTPELCSKLPHHANERILSHDRSNFRQLLHTLKVTPFTSVEEVQAKMENFLKGLAKPSFQNYYQQWQHRMQKCVNAEGNYFKGDSVTVCKVQRIYPSGYSFSKVVKRRAEVGFSTKPIQKFYPLVVSTSGDPIFHAGIGEGTCLGRFPKTTSETGFSFILRTLFSAEVLDI